MRERLQSRGVTGFLYSLYSYRVKLAIFEKRCREKERFDFNTSTGIAPVLIMPK